MEIRLYAVLSYYVDTLEEARARGMVTTDEDQARGMASALYADDARIVETVVTVPATAWTEYAA